MCKQIRLDQYIGKRIKCRCGKSHFSEIRKIDIEAGAIERIPAFLKKEGKSKVFLVSDVHTWEAAGKRTYERLTKEGITVEKIVLPYEELVPDEKVLGQLFVACPMDSDVVLAVGSGTINDLCKFVSHRLQKEYFILATAPSIDGFVSEGAALMINYVKTTYEAHGPIAVFADTDILAKAPMNMITAGLGDLLGKYTCLLDWKMAHLIEGEYYCEEIEQMVRTSIEIVKIQGKKIKTRDPEAMKSIMEALVLTGMAMKFVGNSRPASGCEHHLSHYWEMKFLMEGKKAILHGTKVGIGVITATQMYHMLAEDTIEFERAMQKGFNRKAWEAKVRECYGEAAEGILYLEEQCKKNDLEKRNQRLFYMKENWTMIQKEIKSSLPETQEIEQLLAELGAPTNPKQIGISMDFLKDGILLAKEVRNRFTLLQILWDTGRLEDYSKKMCEYFEERQE